LVTCAELSWIDGPAWAGTAQPAARQVPRIASKATAAFLAGPELRRPVATAGDDRIGADFGVRADVSVRGMMTDLTYAGCSNALTPGNHATVWDGAAGG
jgi:hypothetical protein